MPPDSSQPNPLNYAQAPRNDLRIIAVRQRAIMYCILANIALYVVVFAASAGNLPLVAGIAALGVFAVAITAAVFIFMLSLAVYNLAAGIVLGILTLVPLLGLLVLLMINSKATKILRAHGVRVGLLGANPNLIPSA